MMKRHCFLSSSVAFQGVYACHDRAWCRPVEVFGHLRKALPNSEGQVITAHQLLDGILPHAHSVQASQGLQQVGPQQASSPHRLGIIKKSAAIPWRAFCHLTYCAYFAVHVDAHKLVKALQRWPCPVGLSPQAQFGSELYQVYHVEA